MSNASDIAAQMETTVDTSALLKRALGDNTFEQKKLQSCLVQIYPPDVVDGMISLNGDVLTMGRDIEGDVVLSDSSVSRSHAHIARYTDGFRVVDLGSTNGTLVNGAPVERKLLRPGDTIGIGSYLFRFLSAGSVETQYHETVYDALTRDALTGTMNRRYLMDSMKREVARAVRQQVWLATIMLDIDHFKLVNDTYGHVVGDDVLREFGRRLLSVCREDDLLARYGGEEFCLLLAGTGPKEAMQAAEQCRTIIYNAPFPTIVGELEVSASFGVACLNPASPISVSSMLSQADANLYRAKELGRNRVCG